MDTEEKIQMNENAYEMAISLAVASTLVCATTEQLDKLLIYITETTFIVFVLDSDVKI